MSAEQIARALSADEVFKIADPVITQDILDAEVTPNTKQNLREKLALELNRSILVTKDAFKKKELRRKLKSLMNDKMTRQQEYDMLEAISAKRSLTGIKRDWQNMKQIITDLNQKVEEKNGVKLKILDNYEKEKEVYEQLKFAKKKGIKHEDGREIGIITPPNSFTVTNSIHGIDSTLKTLKSEIRHNDNLLEKLRVEFDEANRMKNIKQPAVKNLIHAHDADIIELTQKQKDILEEEKLDMQSRLNPGVFEKSLGERIAESHAIFRDLINGTQSEPHITLPFESIGQFSDVNELFVEKSTGRLTNMILIIYRSSNSFGHWCALSRTNDLKSVIYFNPYGTYIDKAMDHIPQEFADQTRQNFPHLLKLLHESDYQVEWNEKQLQRMDPKVATCGRWCGAFMAHIRKGGSLESFQLPFLSVKLPERDAIICKVTEPFLEG